MSNWNEERLPPELQDVARRLRAERRDPSPLELDELKRRARLQASRAHREGVPLKARLVTAMLTIALVGSGSGAVIAAGGGDKESASSSSAAQSQYCPPKSHNPTKKKDPPPGNACGQPNQGNPTPGPGQ